MVTSRSAPVWFRGFHIQDRKSTRLNSSHSQISYAVFCLKKKKRTQNNSHDQKFIDVFYILIHAIIGRNKYRQKHHKGSPAAQQRIHIITLRETTIYYRHH